MNLKQAVKSNFVLIGCPFQTEGLTETIWNRCLEQSEARALSSEGLLAHRQASLFKNLIYMTINQYNYILWGWAPPVIMEI